MTSFILSLPIPHASQPPQINTSKVRIRHNSHTFHISPPSPFNHMATIFQDFKTGEKLSEESWNNVAFDADKDSKGLSSASEGSASKFTSRTSFVKIIKTWSVGYPRSQSTRLARSTPTSNGISPHHLMSTPQKLSPLTTRISSFSLVHISQLDET